MCEKKKERERDAREETRVKSDTAQKTLQGSQGTPLRETTVT